MTKKEAFEYLKETKIFVENNSEKLQKKLFEIGFKWAITGNQEIQHTNEPFLYLYKNGKFLYGNDIISFCNNTKKILKVQEILDIKIDDTTIHDFKPFDRVLVRDDNELEWEIQLFRSYKPDKNYPYACLNFSYKQCIPYDGNEHLLGTNKPE